MTLPLADIKVADFSQVLAGPFAGQLLGDLGAEVIKVEPPEGDSSRVQMPVPGANGSGVTFLTFNRNKRSLVLDITKPKGREIAHVLARWADVVVMNMRVGARQRHGLTYEDLAAVNPRVIYVSITGYG
ncbi:MAG: CoA transferase, partial [Dehalococcoidia bacterium]|nr:CoA transferase [Dehalococcoidia bacterium]